MNEATAPFELLDVKIVSVASTSDLADVFQVSFDIVLKPVNIEVGQSWRADGGYSGEGELSGYVIAPRMVEFEKQDGRWYCR